MLVFWGSFAYDMYADRFLICGGGKEEPVLKKLSVCVLFGGVSSEHEVSLRSAESVLNRLDKDKYHIFPVGITKDGDWILFGGKDYSMLPAGTWQNCEDNRRAALSPVRGQGLLSFENDCVVRERIDVVFPVMHGENCEDGAIQGLLQIAGIPYVGPHVAASAACMDKTITKLIADAAGVRQAAWQLVTREGFARSRENALNTVEARFAYPVFVKPAGTGSSVGVAKAKDRAALEAAIEAALKYDRKVLVEEFISGQEVEVAVLGNDNPFASICGEIDSGAEFYDYDAKYISDCAHLYIPARISEQTTEQVRELAVRVYKAMGCRGMSRVDFFVKSDGEVVFNEINTIPGFTSISMYPKLFEASGIPYEMGLVKNRYIGRTFIQPSQAMREKGVKMKLSAVRSLVAGKRVALIDDSIVRGTTSLRIVRLLKAAGAKEVHVRIASPKMTHPCFYGVDTSTCDQLIGHRCSVEEICRQIEADSLAFLSEGALLRAGNRKEMCMACFTGRYPTALYEHAAEIGRKEDKNR